MLEKNENSHIFIKKLKIVSSLSDSEIKAINSLQTFVKKIDKDIDIVSFKENPSSCCLILDGWVGRYRILVDGKRQFLSFHTVGDIPDLHGLHVSPLDYSICTLTPVIVAFISHDQLRELINNFKGISTAFWRYTIADSAALRAWMVNMGHRTACKALAHLFCEIFIKIAIVEHKEDKNFRLPITQIEMADALGISPVHVNRVINELRENDLITLKSRFIKIKNWEKLANFCNFDPSYLHGNFI